MNILAILVRCESDDTVAWHFDTKGTFFGQIGFTMSLRIREKRAYPVQRAPALCGVWRRVSVASLTLACAMRGDRDSNPGPSGHRR